MQSWDFLGRESERVCDPAWLRGRVLTQPQPCMGVPTHSSSSICWRFLTEVTLCLLLWGKKKKKLCLQDDLAFELGECPDQEEDFLLMALSLTDLSGKSLKAELTLRSLCSADTWMFMKQQRRNSWAWGQRTSCWCDCLQLLSLSWRDLPSVKLDTHYLLTGDNRGACCGGLHILKICTKI